MLFIAPYSSAKMNQGTGFTELMGICHVRQMFDHNFISRNDGHRIFFLHLNTASPKLPSSIWKRNKIKLEGR